MSNEHLHPLFYQIVEGLIRSAEKPELPPNVHPLFGPAIYSYTRAQAIEDGVLINLGMFVSDAGIPVLELVGIRLPVAMTSAAYDLVIGERDGELLPSDEATRRVIYFLATLKRAIVADRSGDPQLLEFTCTSVDLKQLELKAVCGPGDDARPVITVMLPTED